MIINSPYSHHFTCTTIIDHHSRTSIHKSCLQRLQPSLTQWLKPSIAIYTIVSLSQRFHTITSFTFAGNHFTCISFTFTGTFTTSFSSFRWLHDHITHYDNMVSPDISPCFPRFLTKHHELHEVSCQLTTCFTMFPPGFTSHVSPRDARRAFAQTPQRWPRRNRRPSCTTRGRVPRRTEPWRLAFGFSRVSLQR